MAVTFAAAAALAALHLLASRLRALDRIPRSRWLSAAGGVSVAYVIVHLLPEVAAVQVDIEDRLGGALPWLERHAWLLVLAGLLTFYALQQHAVRERRRSGGEGTPDSVGRLHLATYAGYNALIGYLLTEVAREGRLELLAFAVAMGLHFVVNDHGLRADHGALYQRVGRWAVSAAVLAGWAAGAVTHLPPEAIGLPLAFLAGSVVLNVLKEELPAERESRLLPFLAAAAGYSALLLAV